jgi:hypothetical protein
MNEEKENKVFDTFETVHINFFSLNWTVETVIEYQLNSKFDI